MTITKIKNTCQAVLLHWSSNALFSLTESDKQDSWRPRALAGKSLRGPFSQQQPLDWPLHISPRHGLPRASSHNTHSRRSLVRHLSSVVHSSGAPSSVASAISAQWPSLVDLLSALAGAPSTDSIWWRCFLYVFIDTTFCSGSLYSHLHHHYLWSFLLCSSNLTILTLFIPHTSA